MTNFYFPFGEPLKKVEQTDQTPKKVFILGVYASAVHAKWIGQDGKIKVNALAVASEPYIFWKGEDAETIIRGIKVPPQLGKLVPADKKFNGPSGIALDNLYIRPLGLSRKDVWLCDLLPYSRGNDGQRNAITRAYDPIYSKFNLQPADIPYFSKPDLASIERRSEIMNEIIKSQAETIILLGDLPIKYFMKHYDAKFTTLNELSKEGYGMEFEVRIEEKLYKVIALCHPRQAAQLGSHSSDWSRLHAEWVAKQVAMNN